VNVAVSNRGERVGSKLRNWKQAMLTMQVPDERLDLVSRWLIMTRTAVTPMTLTSGLIGGLLASHASHPNWLYFALALVGLWLAHASNNLTNDYFDLVNGVDTASAPRALYAPHPVLAGWLSRRQLMLAIAVLNLIDAAIMGVLFLVRGWPVVAFGVMGLFISVFYVAPPLRLKHHGLGEPGVFIVWGPLMVCGTYYVTAGALPGSIWLASIPYAILVTTVLFGKHIDKTPYDSAQNVRTLPVILGEQHALLLNEALMVLFYAVTVGLVLGGVIGLWALLVLAALPMLRRTLALYSQPKPQKPPAGYPVWPLWYVSAAFVHTRRAGALLVLGLLLNAVMSR